MLSWPDSRAVGLERESSPSVFKDLALPHTVGVTAGLWSPLPRPQLCRQPAEPTLPGACPRQPAAAGPERLPRQALPSWGGDCAEPPRGMCFNWKFMFNWRVTCFMWDQRADSPQICNGDKKYIITCLLCEGRSFIFNSYKDSLARKERFLKARFAWIFITPNIFIAEISALLAYVLLNLASNRRKEIRRLHCPQIISELLWPWQPT